MSLRRIGQLLLTLIAAFVVAPAAAQATGTIDTVSPQSGISTGGTPLVITVNGNVDPNAVVYVGDTPAPGSSSQPNYTYCPDVLDTTCVPGVHGIFFTATSPPGAVGTVDVTLRSADGTVVRGATPTVDDFTYWPPSDLEKGRCGQVEAFYGATNPVTTVTIGGAPATFTLEINGLVLMTMPPASTSGQVLANGIPAGYVRDGCFFPYPDIGDQRTGINQVRGTGSGPTTGGNTVELWAYGPRSYDPFQAGSVLWFGDTPAASTTITAEPCLPEFPKCTPGEQGWTVKAVAPPGPAGWTDLTIHEPDGTVIRGQTSGANDYLYVAPAPTGPTISGIGGAGKTGLGGLILVRGSKLSPVKALTVGSRKAIVFVATPTLVYALVPSLPAGSYPVKLATKAGTTTAAATFTFK